ncbi:MAG TPA: DUF402 domain-containing protein [Gaiellaceae bacterium]
MQAGDPVLLRSSYRGVVRWCWPHHYVGEWNGRHGIYVQPGSRGKLMRRAIGASYLDYWVTDAPAFDYVWEQTHVLRFMREGDGHTVELFWDTEWSFLGWYVNLQAPLIIRGHRFDTTDWALDVWVEPDGAWRWKDEDDFARAQELGVFDADEAARIRAEGERVIAAQPWPTGWEDWRPPGDWKPLELPAGWHVV